ncbi:MAG: hypothetical protein IJM37_07610 [Lachnospiraceae bacterium]|nr:hypothetical protein [Lachnospiraceae bacterium]
MKNLSKYSVLFATGGGGYYLIEHLYRGYSHWSMFVLGGICVILCGLINEGSRRYLPLWIQMIICMVIITALEMDAGLVFNIWLGMEVWDYSHQPLNFMGQICPLYSIYWFLLSVAAIFADDYLRYWLYGEEKPLYILRIYQMKLYK